MPNYIGLDLGGTNIKAGIVDDAGTILTQTSVATPSQASVDALVDALANVCQTLANAANLPIDQVAAIGIGSPGAIDFENGIIKRSPNLPNFSDTPLAKLLRQKIGRPTYLENDANAAAFGEFWAGAGRDQAIKYMVMITLGTGIGGGIITNGKLVHGHAGFAGEIGHMIVQPHGRPGAAKTLGTLESYASAPHTAKRAREALEQSPNAEASALASILANTGTLTAKDVFDTAQTGDPIAAQVAEETAMYLAIACVNFCRILDPQMIVFAGGMIAAGDYLFSRIRAEFQALTWNVVPEHVQLVPAQLGNDAGFIGAAAVAHTQANP